MRERSIALASALLASALHEEWRKTRKKNDSIYEPRWKKTEDVVWIRLHGTDEVDIANTQYLELPIDWQSENKASAEVTISLLKEAVEKGIEFNEAFIEKASAKIHEAWVERNESWAPANQTQSYNKLSEEDKEKDRMIIRKAISILYLEN